MAESGLSTLQRPELIFGIAAPIGVQLDRVVDAVSESLRAVKYTTHYIKLTAEMEAFPVENVSATGKDYYSQVIYKMDYASALCKKRKDTSTLAAISIHAIQNRRNVITNGDGSVPQATAYIISQFKRPDEISLLRRIYGKQFILLSAYGPVKGRTSWIIEQIRKNLSAERTANGIEKLAKDLVDRDADEETDKYGQHLRDTFHMADVFVDGMDYSNTRGTINRFIQALFGKTDISPSKEEYGMYMAKSASLRSSDLSRQIGAAIFSLDGELITQGCNEVPKAFGGTYWDLEKPDFRDVKIGYDPNEQLKNEILRDLFQRLSKANYLNKEILSSGSISEIVLEATRKARTDDQENGPLAGSLIMDLTEYGRVVHAEMCAICDAARLGRSVKQAVLFCTTFPCHNCTKHILAAGISRVVYMEPYPKSRAKDLHQNEIEIDEDVPNRVSFVPFLGISPSKYRDVFQKGRRKDSSGGAKQWIADAPLPVLEVVFPSYLQNEDFVKLNMVVDLLPTNPAASSPPTSATPDGSAPHP